jgi:hypothetical protein
MYKNNHFLGLNWGMKYLSSLLLFLFIMVSCTSEDKTVPTDLLAQDKMVLVLADIHLAESVVAAKELNKDTSLFLYRELEKQIFEKHAVTKSDFLKSFAWYTENVDEYKDLYTKVGDTLNVRSSTVK